MSDPIKLLFIEDNQAYAKLVHLLLDENPGMWETKHTFRLADGLELIKKGEPFDAVIVDLFLPDSQGLNSIVQVKEHLPDCRLIVLTALYNPAMKEEALRLGACEYMLKDQISEERLREVVLRVEPQKKV